MDYDVRSIRSFATLAATASFTKAADRLGVAQPHLSARIKALEQQLGFALFKRTSRRVEITPCGKRFLDGASTLLKEVENLERLGVEIRRGQASSITVGTGNCHANIRWALLGPFIDRHPEIDLRVRVYGSSTEIWTALENGDVDVAMVVPPVPEEFEYQNLHVVSGGLIVNTHSAMAKDEVIHPKRLAAQQIGVFPRSIFPALHDSVLSGLKPYGPWFSELPEAGVECLMTFVRNTGLPAIGVPWWRREEEPPTGIGYRRIEGHRIPLNHVLVRSRAPATAAANALWRLGETFAKRAREPNTGVAVPAAL